MLQNTIAGQTVVTFWYICMLFLILTSDLPTYIYILVSLLTFRRLSKFNNRHYLTDSRAYMQSPQLKSLVSHKLVQYVLQPERKDIKHTHTHIQIRHTQ